MSGTLMSERARAAMCLITALSWICKPQRKRVSVVCPLSPRESGLLSYKPPRQKENQAMVQFLKIIRCVTRYTL